MSSSRLVSIGVGVAATLAVMFLIKGTSIGKQVGLN